FLFCILAGLKVGPESSSLCHCGLVSRRALCGARRVAMAKKRVGFFIYPGIQALDVAGPMDAFAAAVLQDGKGQTTPGYDVFALGFSPTPVGAESGLF